VIASFVLSGFLSFALRPEADYKAPYPNLRPAGACQEPEKTLPRCTGQKGRLDDFEFELKRLNSLLSVSDKK